MSGLIYGYSCPKCDDVQDEEVCQKHPKMLMYLVLDNPYTPVQMSPKGGWCLLKEDADSPICTVPGSSNAAALFAMRIGLALTACSEISDEALNFAYIQTLEELANLVSRHLNTPTAASKHALVRQLALVQLRRYSD